MLIFATTVQRPKHREDFMSAISLPSGTLLKWRYNKRYVGNVHLSKRSKALLVVQITSSTTQQLLPIRMVKNIKETKLGSVYEYQFELGGFPNMVNPLVYPPNEASNSSQPLVFNNEAVNIGECGFTIDHWERTIDSLKKPLKNSNQPLLTDFAYFYLVQIRNLGWPYRLIKLKKGAIRIESGNSFELEVSFVANTNREFELPIGEIVVEPSSSNVELQTSKRVRVDLSQDTRRIHFTASSGYASSTGHLSIKAFNFHYPYGEKPENKKYKRRAICIQRSDIPITIGKVIPHFISLMVGIAASLTLIGFENVKDNYLLMVLMSLISYLGIARGLKK